MRKRILCLVCLALTGVIALLYSMDKERFFSRLRPSVCERVLEEGQQVYISGQVYKKTKKEETMTLYLENIRIQGNQKEPAAGERLLVYQKLSNQINLRIPEIGQQVLVTGTIGFFQESPNPGNFNQKFYYQKQNIHAVLWEADVIRIGGKTSVLREELWKIRTETAEFIRKYMGDEQGGVLCAMLLGETAFTGAELKEVYQKSGIGHLLAISGLHVSFVGLGIYRILRKIGVPMGTAAPAGGGILWVYVMMTGGSVSAVRALIMFLVRMGAQLTGREYDGLSALSLAAIVVLGRNPLMLFDAGFLLSFGAVLGIYGAAPFYEGMWEPIRIPLAIQSTILPAMLYYYYECSLYSVLWNLAVIPLASGVLGTGIAGVLAQILPGAAGDVLSRVFLTVSGGILWFYEAGGRVLLELPGARWVTGQPEMWQILIYYVLIAGGVRLIRKERKVIGSFAALSAVAVLTVSGNAGNQLEVTMLDVGQGDCFFLQGPEGQNWLIDGGSSTVSQVGKYRIEPFLKSQGVGSLDYVWVSHGDEDHIGGIREMLERQKVGVKLHHLVLPPEAVWDSALAELAQTSKSHGTSVLTIEKGQKFQEGAITLTCLWPDGETEEAGNGNENSMVLSLTYGEFDMLFTGDLENEPENEVAELLTNTYEVLKVGHHGSKNGTGEALLEAVRPTAAFCSAGKKNRYGHPHAETLERLAKWGVSLYNTKDRSAVKLCTDGKKYCILIP